MLCLIAVPAMASLIISVQPTAITSGPDTGMSVTGLTTLTVKTNDVIAFQLVGTVTGAGDSGVNSIKGSLAQALGAAGVWNTEVTGSLSTVTLPAEFTCAASHPGVAGVDVNGDGFALDTGSTATAATNYIVPCHSDTTGHGVSGDILGTFTYTVANTSATSIVPTSLNWLVPTNGSSTAKAVWTESGTSENSSTYPTNWGVGTAISLVAVPEPATLVLMSMGALALLLFRRRK